MELVRGDHRPDLQLAVNTKLGRAANKIAQKPRFGCKGLELDSIILQINMGAVPGCSVLPGCIRGRPYLGAEMLQSPEQFATATYCATIDGSRYSVPETRWDTLRGGSCKAV